MRAALRYRDFLTVALMVKKADLFPDNWIYIHDPAVKVGRIQNFGSWSPEMVPAGMSCLGLEYFCFEGDGLWTSADADLIALAEERMRQDRSHRREATWWMPAWCASPRPTRCMTTDYRENVDMIRLDLERTYPTLHLVGRNGMHKYNNQDHAMMTAMLTAQNIVAGERLYDVWDVNEDAEYHEAGCFGRAGKRLQASARCRARPSPAPRSLDGAKRNPGLHLRLDADAPPTAANDFQRSSRIRERKLS